MARLTRPARGDGRVIAGLVGAGEIVYIVLWILLPKRDR